MLPQVDWNSPREMGRNPPFFPVGTQWETRGKTQGYTLNPKARPQKKVLSLVLCVAMMLSVMVMSTGATSFSDEDEFSPQYKEAAEVLTGMGVIQGYEDGSYFLPQRNITRAQVATMIYRAVTHDVNDTQTGIYKDYNKFKDVPSTDWSAGYVNYCANGEIIKGFTPDTFGPLKNVTGYQVLAMILRAVGYDANDEFTGDGWAIRVATTAQQLGILENVQEATLGEAATRELVAELIFQTMTKVDMVDYTPAFGYQPTWPRETLGEDEFGLWLEEDTNDVWGRPSDTWHYDTGNEAAVIEKDALATYTEAATECDVAEAVGLEKTTQVDVYTNGADNKSTDNIRPLATTVKLGDQGQIMELYDANDDGKVDRIVYIDTYLAYVDEVKDATFDKAGHLDKSSELVLWVYDGEDAPKDYEEVTLYGGKTDYDYTEGQYLLVQAVDETQKGSDETPIAKDTKTNEPDTLKIVDVAESIVGTQTHIFENANKHEVNDEVYLDAAQYIMDAAEDNGDENFAWFFDQYGNLIGSAEIADTLSYGVITSIWWSGDSTDGSGKALANVTYMDGTTGQVTLSGMSYYDDTSSKFTESATPVYSTGTGTGLMQVDDGDFGVATSATTNAKTANDKHDIVYGHLFQFTAKADGTVTAKEVAGNGDGLFAKEIAISKDNVKNFTADNSTVFLIRSGNDEDGYTFESITGINNIGKYNKAEVDYVVSDGVADYVYVIASSVASTTTNLFYYNDGQFKQDTSTGDWTVEGWLDGEPASIVVDTAKKTTIQTNDDHAMYKVVITDGKVTSMYHFTKAETSIGIWTGEDVYDSDPATTVVKVTGSTNDSWANNLYQTGSDKYIANADSAVVGEWAQDMSDKNVILVIDGDTNLVLQAYIVDKAEDDPTIEDKDYTVTKSDLGLNNGKFEVSFETKDALPIGAAITTTVYKSDNSEGNAKVTSWTQNVGKTSVDKTVTSADAIAESGNYYAEVVIKDSEGTTLVSFETGIVRLAK